MDNLEKISLLLNGLSDNDKKKLLDREYLGVSNFLIGNVLDGVSHPESLSHEEAVGIICRLKAHRDYVIFAMSLNNKNDSGLKEQEL